MVDDCDGRISVYEASQLLQEVGMVENGGRGRPLLREVMGRLRHLAWNIW